MFTNAVYSCYSFTRCPSPPLQVVNAWDAVPRLPSCASWVFQVLPAPAVTGIALGLGLKVQLACSELVKYTYIYVYIKTHTNRTYSCASSTVSRLTTTALLFFCSLTFSHSPPIRCQMQVGLGGLADRVEKAMRPLWPALKAYAPCGTLALIDAEQPGKVGAARVFVCSCLCFFSRNTATFL